MIIFSSARIAGAFVVAPFFNSQLVPGMARNVLILNFAAMIVPLTLTQMPDKITAGLFIMVIVKEVLIGFIMGILISLVFFIAQGAGAFIDTQRGASIGQLFDPSLGESSTLLATLFTKFLIVLFFVGGGFLAFLTFLYESYKVWPIFSFFPNFNNVVFPKYVLQIADIIMSNAVLLAAPVVIIMFLSDFGLGLMNRFAPQLNVFSIAFGIKSGIAAFILIIYFDILNRLFEEQIINGRKLLYLFQKIF